MRKIIKLSLVSAWAVLLAAPNLSGQEYAWPLKIPPKLSSQFGDYRAGHWHAGIDITTRGKPGYKVYAIDDGYISRVKASFWGYGNALYLNLDDGRVAVYGHLTGFNRTLNDYVHRRQMESKRYYQDLFFGPAEYRVKKGEYIALSGQTGSGAPHLHLEIRDRDNLPLNPLRGIYRFADNQPPSIDYLAIKRYKDVGQGNYHEIEFLKLEGNRPFYSVRDTIALYDQNVFIISGHDPDQSYYYGLFAGSLVLDGREIFSFKNEKMDYSTGYQIDYVRDLHLRKLIESVKGPNDDNDKNVFYRLYIQPGDRQLFYGNYSYPDGIISADRIDGSLHELKILVSDFNDNVSEIRLYLKKAVLPKPEIDGLTIIGDTLVISSNQIGREKSLQVQRRRHDADTYETIPIKEDLNGGAVSYLIGKKTYDYRLRTVDRKTQFSPWTEFNLDAARENVRAFADYLEFIVKDDEAIRANNVSLKNFYALPLPNGFHKTRVPVPVTNGYFEISLEDGQAQNGYFVFNSGGTAYSPDSSIKIDIGRKQLYGPAIIQVSSPVRARAGLEFEIRPDNLLFAGNVTIAVKHQSLNLDPARSSLYYYLSAKDRWIYIGDNTAGAIQGETGGGGRFGILEDLQGPSITGIRPANKSSTADMKPYLSCRITDNLSGIKDEAQLEMTLDGVWVPAYYDIDSKEFGYQVKNPLKKASHSLRIRAVDNQGNESVAVSKFTIR